MNKKQTTIIWLMAIFISAVVLIKLFIIALLSAVTMSIMLFIARKLVYYQMDWNTALLYSIITLVMGSFLIYILRDENK